MRPSRILTIATLLLILWLPALVASEDSFDLEVGKCAGILCTWVDLSDLLTADRIARLKEGVPLLVSCQSHLTRPRRLWGSEELARETWEARLAYRPVTQDYSLASADSREEIFSSLARLHRHLSDSITIKLISADSLEVTSPLRINAKISLTWLTAFNLPHGGSKADSSSSLIRFLFGRFLELSGYGREELQVSSGLFVPDDLPVISE